VTPKQHELLAAVRDMQRYGELFREARDRVNRLMCEVCGEDPREPAAQARNAFPE